MSIDQPSSAVSPVGGFVIKGVTSGGKVFRPSDWADRLAGVLASVCHPSGEPGGHLLYAPEVLPILYEGERAIQVLGSVQTEYPMAYRFLLGFARDNDLLIICS
jgi:Protein of unknown function (DUF3579)